MFEIVTVQTLTGVLTVLVTVVVMQMRRKVTEITGLLFSASLSLSLSCVCVRALRPVTELFQT